MTNREKISNEQLARFIFDGCCEYCNYCILQGQCYSNRCESHGTCINNIESWLSQEVEEDTVHIPLIGKMPKTDKIVELTEQAYKNILSRLDNLEESEYHNAMAIERLEKINEYESNIDDVETKTADEMFKELGYEKISDCEYKRINPDRNGREVFITIDDGEVIKYIKDKELNAGIAEWILSKEVKAIHKKIEELKHA